MSKSKNYDATFTQYWTYVVMAEMMTHEYTYIAAKLMDELKNSKLKELYQRYVLQDSKELFDNINFSFVPNEYGQHDNHTEETRNE